MEQGGKGELQVGRYKVQFAKFSEGNWRAHGPWMRVVVTNERLVVMPDDVSPSGKAPLEIMADTILRVWSICLGRRDGIVVALSSGDLLYFFVEWSESVRLVRDVRQMIRPATPVNNWPRRTPGRYIN